MLVGALCLSLASYVSCLSLDSAESASQSLEVALIKSLKNDVNLDLPADEEYEDLRAELLAYHTALRSLVDSVQNKSEPGARRSIRSKPCWERGGICVKRYLCDGHRYDFQVPGCKDEKNVCCYAWNEYRVRTEKGLAGPGYPWKHYEEPFQGKGLVMVTQKAKGKKKRSRKTTPDPYGNGRDNDNVDIPTKLKNFVKDDGLVVVDID